MLIAQLSDLHVRPHGVLYKGVADSNRMLAQAIAHLHALDRSPDLVLLTGDIVDEGTPAEYAAALELLGRLEIPYLVLPGNHDHREHFRAAFAAHRYLPADGPLHYCIDAHPVRIIGLDSCVPGLHHGHVDASGLAWLRTTLAQSPAKPTVVMLHHPPFTCGIPYMDKYRYMQADALAEVLAEFACVEAVLCGHVHRLMLRRWAGTMVCACPSTTTEIALQLRSDAPPLSYLGPPACLLHLWQPGQGLVTHLSHIGTFAGPYPFA